MVIAIETIFRSLNVLILLCETVEIILIGFLTICLFLLVSEVWQTNLILM